MRKIYYNPNMKKCIFALCALVVCALPVVAQQEAAMDENPDSIKVSYVPRSFWDNWELSVAGGVSILFNGIGHDAGTMSAPADGSGYKTYDAIGGVGEIAATKWFNPYIAGRIGWMTGYLPYTEADNSLSNIAKWHNYAHVDMLWDWTTQFGGYKPDRIYDAAPYVHVGIVGNPGYTVMIGGGIGLLNRFHLNDSWLINLDLRATATSSRKFGLESGIAFDVNALVGVSYRFKEQGWKKKMYNPYGPEVRRLQDENDDLKRQLDNAQQVNESLAQEVQKAQEEKILTEVVTKEVFRGIPDTLEMTVYYAINSSKLSAYEQAHLNTYIRMINFNDPNREHRYCVIGTADQGTGTLEVNQRVSLERANAIKQALMDNGIREELIDLQTRIVPDGEASMARASHVIVYPLQ